jgi:predicted nucleotidyltransferase
MKASDRDIIKQVLVSSPEVAAAYLFGSAATGDELARDVDILILPYPGVYPTHVYFEVTHRITQSLQTTDDRVDVLLFDLDEADPEVLYSALTNGMLIKNASPDLLSEKIEALSSYFLINEFMIENAKRLEAERLEAYSAG